MASDNSSIESLVRVREESSLEEERLSTIGRLFLDPYPERTVKLSLSSRINFVPLGRVAVLCDFLRRLLWSIEVKDVARHFFKPGGVNVVELDLQSPG